MKLVLLLHLKMPELKMKKRVDERERQSPSEPQMGQWTVILRSGASGTLLNP